MTLSRMMLGVACLAVAQSAPAQTTSPLAIYERLTTVSPQCHAPTNNTEILVCGRRAADRWRVPFVGYDAGDPRAETVMAERERLAANPQAPCGTAAILKNCGAVGVSLSTRFGIDGSGYKLRPLAP